MHAFTNQELCAYLAEELAVSRSRELEEVLRTDAGVREQLRRLLDESDCPSLTLRNVWLRGRMSCPSRATLVEYAAENLGDGLHQYLNFHLHVVGCRFCAANLADLQEQGGADATDRNRKFFETSVGRLRHIDG